jgi:hypothetical protein
MKPEAHLYQRRSQLVSAIHWESGSLSDAEKIGRWVKENGGCANLAPMILGRQVFFQVSNAIGIPQNFPVIVSKGNVVVLESFGIFRVYKLSEFKALYDLAPMQDYTGWMDEGHSEISDIPYGPQPESPQSRRIREIYEDT